MMKFRKLGIRPLPSHEQCRKLYDWIFADPLRDCDRLNLVLEIQREFLRKRVVDFGGIRGTVLYIYYVHPASLRGGFSTPPRGHTLVAWVRWRSGRQSMKPVTSLRRVVPPRKKR